MEVIATTRNLRMSARKVRLVVDLIRGMEVAPALSQLQFLAKDASVPVTKLLKSAMANAEHNFRFEKDTLFIKTIKVDQGSPLKRWRARAFGRAAPIMKHSCHITLILEPKAGAKPMTGAVSEGEHKKKVLHESGIEAGVPKGKMTADMAEGHAPEAIDTRRMGKHRNNQNVDRKSEKGPGGARRRVFNRKAG